MSEPTEIDMKRAEREFRIVGALPLSGEGETIGLGDVVWVVETATEIRGYRPPCVIFPLVVEGLDASGGVTAHHGSRPRVLARECYLDIREAFKHARALAGAMTAAPRLDVQA